MYFCSFFIYGWNHIVMLPPPCSASSWFLLHVCQLLTDYLHLGGTIQVVFFAFCILQNFNLCDFEFKMVAFTDLKKD